MNQTAPASQTTSYSSLSDELSHRVISQYSISTDLSSELRVATLAYFSLQQEFNRISKAIKTGATPEIERISPLLQALVESIIRNPAAGVWLARLKSKSSYAHRHCISCAILCTVMGRQLGLDIESMFKLSLAGLFMDNGKLLLPDSLMRKTESLTDEEVLETHQHIQLGLKSVRKAGLPEEVLQTIRSHHERFDGSGYPSQLAGTDIPLYARIASIVDCYDAMTSPRYYATPIPHSEAIMKLAGWRKSLFQKELVDTFIQAIGLYPPGSLVELTSGEVAVVSDFRVGMGRKPELTVILDANKKRLVRKKVLKLSGKEGNIDIAKNLPPDAYDLDPEALF
ncbi:HD domain-containing protein [Porticoccaceae bacterium]|jgi:HD-GYP domain-containing protein (c-di-GMP phosphodiesterase class II)|nr:HD domain-containing protein [Porticoccaceae bacterium]MDC1477161.1 HD domain-containing protein [Porticoccaceae bacterium]CAI8260611.1 MAG: Cyclic di-GMP phosphodiesterase response regulator RpfG [SAR92 bacterium MED-G29]|tara:strand:- start:4295 stop:5314 length:1020 start_codon:yes stop_codon:yes gene_type:complete